MSNTVLWIPFPNAKKNTDPFDCNRDGTCKAWVPNPGTSGVICKWDCDPRDGCTTDLDANLAVEGDRNCGVVPVEGDRNVVAVGGDPSLAVGDDLWYCCY